MNLVLNARDAMPDGGSITVSARNVQIGTAAQPGLDLAPGRYVVLSVRDTGCGIEQHLLDQVLEPFFTTKALGKGTGLGLSMVYGFAQQSGGAVRVESEVGIGTCVEIWLPEGAAGEDCAPLVVESVGSTAPLNILLVDDHDAVRTTTAALLEDLGHRVIHMADAGSAVELARHDPHAFDLLITDYAMPRTSGTELVRQLRSVCPAMPALIITGYADADQLGDCEGIAILEKPFSAEQLKIALIGTAPVLRQEQRV